MSEGAAQFCRNCGAQIGATDNFCGQCGADLQQAPSATGEPAAPKDDRSELLIITTVFVLIALVLAAIVAWNLSPSSQVGAVKDTVRRNAKDPSSIIFGDISPCPKDPKLFNGSYNGKNSYGAYAGESQFFSDGVTASFADDYDFYDKLRRCYGLSEGNDGEAVNSAGNAID